MNILLVRHGETAWNREGRYQGRTDIPLSPDGEQQVRALGDRLRHVDIAIAISSPLSRARATAEAILGASGIPAVSVANALGSAPLGDPSGPAAARTAQRPALEFDDGLLEISHGQWEGKLASDVELSHAEMFGIWKSAPGRSAPAGPDAETLGDVEARAWPVLERLCARLAADDTGLITAHDAVNRVLLCRIVGIPLERVWSFRQSPAALNVLSGPSLAQLQLVRLNDSEHAAPLLREAQHRAL
jgi:phosphoserine phosphatase